MLCVHCESFILFICSYFGFVEKVKLLCATLYFPSVCYLLENGNINFTFSLRFSHFFLSLSISLPICSHPSSRILVWSAPHVYAVCTGLFIFINWVKYILLFDIFYATLDDAERVTHTKHTHIAFPYIRKAECARDSLKLRPEDS